MAYVDGYVMPLPKQNARRMIFGGFWVIVAKS
jgi:uncharacterized protein YbaA (DUF1428 family)